MPLRSLLVLVFLFGLFLPSPGFAGGDKPVRTVDITWISPETLDDLWREADVVARVRVETASPKSKPAAPGIKTPYVYTEARIQFVQKYRARRDDVKKVSSLVVAQRAGRLELADEIIEIAGAEPLVPGREYVLFLQWNDWFGHYEVTAGPDAIYELKDGHVRPFGRSAVARERAGRSADDFLGDLRLRASLEP